MPGPSTIDGDYAALNELIVNCPDFGKLESLLGGFNLFRVLAFEHGEIRHSNVLAWILDPAESHGLDSTFLQKWLMRVIHESPGHTGAVITPVDIDAWQLVDVEVRREWKNIDLLLVLNFAGGQQWIVSIENKINSMQHSDQLARYRRIVEQTFPSAKRHLFLFLTKSNESPDDERYLSASYSQVHQVLRECVVSRSHAIGQEPRVLLENYLRLLEEKFMDESEIARTALRIYQQHRRALDVIFEHRPDNLRMASDRVTNLLSDAAERLGIVMEPGSKSYIRFIPKAWDQLGNSRGDAWAGCTRTVLFEINLMGKRPYLYVMSGKAPDSWIEVMWNRAGSAPYNRPKKNKVRPKTWCTLHLTTKTEIELDDETLTNPDDIAEKIFRWCVASFETPDTQEVIRLIAGELPQLEAAYARLKS